MACRLRYRTEEILGRMGRRTTGFLLDIYCRNCFATKKLC